MEKRDGSLRAVSTGMCRELCSSTTPSCSVPASLQTDPGEYSPSSTTRWQGHALPCLTCTWPPAFVSAILLLSIGPGGSVREESTRLKPFCIPCCHPIQLISHANSLVISALPWGPCRQSGWLDSLQPQVVPVRYSAHRGGTPSIHTSCHSTSHHHQSPEVSGSLPLSFPLTKASHSRNHCMLIQ